MIELLLIGVLLMQFMLFRAVNNLNRKTNKIMGTQAEAAAQLTAINAELVKIGTETQALLDKVAALQAAADAAGNVSPELQAAIDGVVAQAKTVDDLVPDPA